MKVSKVLVTLIVVGFIVGIAIFLSMQSGPYSFTGKISSFSYYQRDLHTFTQVNFYDGTSISFSGNLIFEVEKTYSFTYYKSGLLWEILGGEATYSLTYSSVEQEMPI
jgi:hypothetical protein